MKKALLFAVVLSLILGAASCSLFKNYDYVNDAILKTSALNSAKIEVETSIQLSGEEPATSSHTVSMKGLQTNAPIWKTETDVTLYGETVPASVYYEAPYYYAVTETDSVKLETGDLIAKTDFVSDWKMMTGIIPEEALKTASAVDRGDGTKATVISFGANAFAQLYGDLLSKWHASLVNDYVGEYLSSELMISDTMAEIVVNENNGYLVSFGIFCKMDIASKNKAGEDKPISASLSHQVIYHEAGADIPVDLPEGAADFELTDGLKLDAYQLMTNAVEKTKKKNDFKADIDLDISFRMMGIQMDMPTSIALCVKNAHTEDHEFGYTMEMSALGMEITQNVYFKDGFYYMDDGIYKIQYPQSAENEKEFGYQSDIDMLLKTLPETFFEGVEVQRNEDGTKTITLNVQSVFRYYTELTEDIKNSLGYNLLWSDGDLTIVIDRDGSLKSYELILCPEAFIAGVQTKFDITYGITYHNGEEAAISNIPADLNEYQTMQQINGEVYDIIDRAIDGFLNAEQMSFVGELNNQILINKNLVSLTMQAYTFAGNQLNTYAPVYRYLINSEVNGYDFKQLLTEDVYYKDGFYYIDSDLLEEPVKIAEAQIPSYNILAAVSKVLKKLPDDAMENIVTQGTKGTVCTLSWELDQEDFEALFPELGKIDAETLGLEGYRVSSKDVKTALLEIVTDANGKLYTYSLSYEISATLSPTFGLYLKDETLTFTESVCYVFDTSDTAVIVEPSEAYLALQ